MDINRYYVPPKPRRESEADRENRFKAATSRFTRGVNRLPTPAAFFQRQQEFKEADKRAMLRFAQKKAVKHNLKVRRKELKTQQEKEIEELTERIFGRNGKKIEKVEKAEAKDDAAVGEVEKGAVEEEEGEGTTGFEFTDLRVSLDRQDNVNINKNILRSFFELKDPSRIDEVDQLLAENNGSEFELFDRIAKEYSVVKTNPAHSAEERALTKRLGSYTSMRDYKVTNRPRSSFIEQLPVPVPVAKEETKPAPAPVTQPKGVDKSGDVRPPRQSFIERAKKLGAGSPHGRSAQSVISIESAALSLDPENEELKEFQQALDAEIKGKFGTGEYVTSIKERGGRWWVNRNPPKVHPSRRRRDTLLDDLRNGNVPLSI